jgi:hypothetical protein
VRRGRFVRAEFRRLLRVRGPLRLSTEPEGAPRVPRVPQQHRDTVSLSATSNGTQPRSRVHPLVGHLLAVRPAAWVLRYSRKQFPCVSRGHLECDDEWGGWSPASGAKQPGKRRSVGDRWRLGGAPWHGNFGRRVQRAWRLCRWVRVREPRRGQSIVRDTRRNVPTHRRVRLPQPSAIRTVAAPTPVTTSSLA